MTDILDLTTGQTQGVEITVEREAEFDNTVDFYQVEADGSVIDPALGEAIAVGESGYAEAAISSRLGLDLATENGATTEFTADFAENALYAPILAVDGGLELLADADPHNDPVVYFSDAAANPDGFDHVNVLAENQFAFEDLPNGGDEDFNDIVVTVTSDGNAPVPTNPTDPGNPTGDPTELGSISGTKFEDLNGNGVRDVGIDIQGENPDVVFVVDTSGSTDDLFQGTSVGDLNGNGVADEIIDAEIAGFIELNQQLVEQGLGDTVEVGIVGFSTGAAAVDLDPNEPGEQLTITPNTDNDGNGVSDVEDILRSTSSGGDTNFEAALQESEAIFASSGTQSGEGNLIFLSDGEVNTGGNYDDEAARLNDAGVNVAAFGVGSDASLAQLQVIDPNASILTSTDQILSVFGDIESDDNDNTTDPDVDPAAPGTTEAGIEGVSIYLDVNENGVLDADEPTQVTDANGLYSFADLVPGTYTVREVVPTGFSQTSPIEGQFTVEVTGGEVIEELDFGNISDATPEDPAAPEPDSSGGIAGAEFQLQVFNPRANAISEVITTEIGDGVEFSGLPNLALPGSSLVDVNIDIAGGVAGEGSFLFEVVESDSGSFATGEFNGYVFTDVSDELPAMENVTINDSANSLGVEASDISFSENSLKVNVESISFDPGDSLLLDVEFADV